MSSGGTTTPSQSHRLPCTPQEAWKVRCLNGGTCFAWDSGGGTRSIGCSCTSEWTGNRCEYMYIDPDDWAISDASPTIALAIALPLLFIFVIVAVIVFFCIRRKRKGQKLQRLQSSTSASISNSLSKTPVSENHYERQTPVSENHYDRQTPVSVNHYERQTTVTVNHYEGKTTLSPQNGQSKAKYDSPDMTASTQVSALSDSQRLSSNGNQTTPRVFWESAV